MSGFEILHYILHYILLQRKYLVPLYAKVLCMLFFLIFLNQAGLSMSKIFKNVSITIVFSFVSCLLFSHALAYDNDDTPNEGYIIGIHAGYAAPAKFRDLLTKNYFVGGHFGYKYDNFRTELEASTMRNLFKHKSQGGAIENTDPKPKYNVFSAMLNFYYDVGFNEFMTPFFGVGAGYINLNKSDYQGGKAYLQFVPTADSFAYQGIAGMYFNLNKMQVGASYTFLSMYGQRAFSQHIISAFLSYQIDA